MRTIRTLAAITLVAMLFSGCLPGVGSSSGGGTVKDTSGEPMSWLGVTLATKETPDTPQKNFAVADTSVVVWKLNLQRHDNESVHTVRAEWYWHDGTLKWKEDRTIAPGRAGTVSVVGGKGYSEAGAWEPGVYTIKFYLDGSPIGEELFRVIGADAEPEDNPIMLAGVDFHYAGDISTPVRVFAQDDTDMVIWFANFSVTNEAAGEHSMLATWFAPDGTALWREERDFVINYGASTKSVAGGQGFDTPGKWAIGKYTLVLTLDGEPIGEGSFSVGETTEGGGEMTPTGTEGLDLYGLSFYNRGDYANRVDRFDNDATAMIVWAVSISRQPDGATGTHTITAAWYMPDGTVKWTQDKDFELEEVDNAKRIIGGKGYTEPGNWVAGEWTVKFYLDGEFIGKDSFTIE